MMNIFSLLSEIRVTFRWRCKLRLVCFLATAFIGGAAALDEPISNILDTPVPGWDFADWINSPPIGIEELRGKVVLVRWWTAPDCPFCAATAPSLNEWYRRYRERGLVIIGVYHHKANSPLSIDRVRKYSRAFGFKFPIAIDTEWKTLTDWWFKRNPDGRWTSVSFLIDKNGAIRHIHPGGQYVKGEQDYDSMQEKVEELLSEVSSD